MRVVKDHNVIHYTKFIWRYVIDAEQHYIEISMIMIKMLYMHEIKNHVFCETML